MLVPNVVIRGDRREPRGCVNHQLNQLRVKDQKTPERRLKPIISSLTQIQLDNLREKLRAENILQPAEEPDAQQ